MNRAIEEKVRKAIDAAVEQYPELKRVVHGSEIGFSPLIHKVEVNEHGVIWISPKFAVGVSPDILAYAIAHDYYHVLLAHQQRRRLINSWAQDLWPRNAPGYEFFLQKKGPFQHTLWAYVWNACADMEVNDRLDPKVVRMGDGLLAGCEVCKLFLKRKTAEMHLYDALENKAMMGSLVNWLRKEKYV